MTLSHNYSVHKPYLSLYFQNHTTSKQLFFNYKNTIMLYVTQLKSRFHLTNIRPGSIIIGGEVLIGYLADGLYVYPHQLDDDNKGITETVFFESHFSLKVLAPKPPFNGTDTIDDNF